MKSHEMIAELEKKGYIVGIAHMRRIKGKKGFHLVGGDDCNSNDILPRGGMTVISICDKHGVGMDGVATCRDDENFNKKMGVKIALGRALTSGKL